MKIIFSNYDSPHNPYYGGGGANSIHRISLGLVKARYNVTIIAGAFPGSKDQTIDEVKYKYIGIASLAKLNQLLYLLILPYYVLTSNFDVWVESFIPPFSSTFVPFWTNKKVVGFAQLLNAKEFSQKYWRVPFHLIEKIALKKYRHMIVLTESLKKVIVANNPNCQVVSLGLGYDKPKNVYPKSHLDKYYLYMGRIDIFQKGLDLLLASYAETPASTPRLVIAGGGSKKDLDALASLISSYNLGSRVSCLGRVSGIKKEKILSGAIATIIPSRYETFCLSALESIAHGTRVIVSDLPDLAWIPSIAKHTFSLANQGELTHLLSTLYKQKSTYSNQCSRYSNAISNYEWNKVVKEYVAYLRGINNS